MTQAHTTGQERALKEAIKRIEARFHPHYGIDGATDSRQLADDCRTLIAALTQPEPTAQQGGEEAEAKPVTSADLIALLDDPKIYNAVRVPGEPYPHPDTVHEPSTARERTLVFNQCEDHQPLYNGPCKTCGQPALSAQQAAGEAVALRGALKNLLDACYQADGAENLPEEIVRQFAGRRRRGARIAVSGYLDRRAGCHAGSAAGGPVEASIHMRRR